jgi:hypothetical protein
MLFAASTDISFYSVTNMISDVSVMAIDAAEYFAMSAIAGAAAALILGSGKK